MSSAATPRLAAAYSDAKVSFPATPGYRVCMTPGCNRAYLRTKHRHCCSMCRRGLHSPKCTAFQKALQGMKHKVCAILNCNHMVNHGHDTCCAKCVATAGVRHSAGCFERQELLRLQLEPMADNGSGTNAASVSKRSEPAGGEKLPSATYGQTACFARSDSSASMSASGSVKSVDEDVVDICTVFDLCALD